MEITLKRPQQQHITTELMQQVSDLFPAQQFTFDPTWAFNGQLNGTMFKDGINGTTGHVDITVDGRQYAAKEGRVSVWLALPFNSDDLDLVPQYVAMLTKVVERSIKAASHLQLEQDRRKQAAADAEAVVAAPAEEGDL